MSAQSDGEGRVVPFNGASRTTFGLGEAGPSTLASDHGVFRAGLYYIACDLRVLAKRAPAEKGDKLVAMSDLILSLAMP